MSYSDNANSTPLEALRSAVALPDVYSDLELNRTLRRNHYDVMKAALQLREKHEWRKNELLDNLNVAHVQKELRKGYLMLIDEFLDRENCPIVLFRARYFKPSLASSSVTATKDLGTVDGSTSMISAIRTFVYILDLAVETMEEEESQGITYLIDLEGCSSSNIDLTIHLKLAEIAKKWYPEALSHCLVVNGSSFLNGMMSHALLRPLSENTRKKVHILDSLNGKARRKQLEIILKYISERSLPIEYGGKLKLPHIETWILDQANLEEVDLEEESFQTNEDDFMTKEASNLNGMQYSGCNVQEVIDMNTTAIRGQLWRKKGEKTSILLSGWIKEFAVLRPDAILLYDNESTAKRPQVIIPVRDMSIKVDQFPNQPRNSSGFRIVTSMTTYFLAAPSEVDRGRWIQEIEMAAASIQEKEEEAEWKEYRRREADELFDKFNMISFDVEHQSSEKPPPMPSTMQIGVPIQGSTVMSQFPMNIQSRDEVPNNPKYANYNVLQASSIGSHQQFQYAWNGNPQNNFSAQ